MPDRLSGRNDYSTQQNGGQSTQFWPCHMYSSCTTCTYASVGCVWCGSNSTCMDALDEARRPPWNTSLRGPIHAQSQCLAVIKFSSFCSGSFGEGDDTSDRGGLPAPYLVLIGVVACIAVICILRVVTHALKGSTPVVQKRIPLGPLNIQDLEEQCPALRPCIRGGQKHSKAVAAILAIPALFSRSKSEEENLDQQCTVCLVEMEPGDECRQLLCQHVFHKSCIDAWLGKSRECPCCRQDVEELVKREMSRQTKSTTTNVDSSNVDPSDASNDDGEMEQVHNASSPQSLRTTQADAFFSNVDSPICRGISAPGFLLGLQDAPSTPQIPSTPTRPPVLAGDLSSLDPMTPPGTPPQPSTPPPPRTPSPPRTPIGASTPPAIEDPRRSDSEVWFDGQVDTASDVGYI